MDWIEQLQTLQWERLIPELLGKAGGVVLGFAIGWFVLFRKRLKALERAQSGDSDDFIFQAHYLIRDGDQTTLIFRNVAPKTTLNDLYDNIAVRDQVKTLADQCTLTNPVLQTTGTLGFELLNDALGHIAGLLAISPAPRQTWLFMMTCEDRQIVRKKCVRCFLIRPEDLTRFADWQWCITAVAVERPWHWFRVVALHQIALQYQQQTARKNSDGDAQTMPLVNVQDHHDRIRPISIGLAGNETLVGDPHRVDWSSHLASLNQLGLTLHPHGRSLSPKDKPSPPQSAATR